MGKTKKQKTENLPKFDNESQEADWWASSAGRKFLVTQSATKATTGRKGSALANRLNHGTSVQIALRLPTPDLARAREIAGRKGIGYQTLLKMLVHEGLQREARRR
jgi:predicted DNA binding CopG/RHH family protein